MTIEAKPAQGEDLTEKVTRDLEAAEKSEAESKTAFDTASGLGVLGEISPDDVDKAKRAYEAAQATTNALRQAKMVLEARQATQVGAGGTLARSTASSWSYMLSHASTRM